MAKKKKIEKLVDQVFSPIINKPIGQETEEAIIDAASYLNCERALANVKDGCKPSYRRLIWSSLQFPKDELQPSVKLINNMSSYHPHSLTGCEPLLASMVRTGIMYGKGSFGSKTILGEEKPAASPRYTKTCLSSTYGDTIRTLMQCVPKVESPVGPLECEYIPLCTPLCLSFRGLVSGIGYGISTVYPNFSPRSLYMAMMKDDYSLLEPNVNLLIDKKNSELKKLWETGKGRVIYSYKLSRAINEDGKPGFIFEGDTCIFTPNLKKIQKYVEQGSVFIEDLTTKSGPKMFVGLVNNRGIKIDELEKLCRQCCFDATVYNLNVTDGKSAFRISLRDWLRYTYTNYIELLKQVNVREIEKVQFQIAVQEALPHISKYLVETNIKASVKELSQKLSLHPIVIEAALEKPIKQIIQNKDTTDRVKALKQKLKELQAFDPVTYTENIIQQL